MNPKKIGSEFLKYFEKQEVIKELGTQIALRSAVQDLKAQIPLPSAVGRLKSEEEQLFFAQVPGNCISTLGRFHNLFIINTLHFIAIFLI